jgi:hypothetical protein
MRPGVGLGETAERVYEAAQALVESRVELLLAQARAWARGGAGVGVGLLFALAGWFYFVAGVIEALARDHPRFAVQMGVGGAHVALGVALFFAARRATVTSGSRT